MSILISLLLIEQHLREQRKKKFDPIPNRNAMEESRGGGMRNRDNAGLNYYRLDQM